MGVPQHYGLELPVRCLALIDELLPRAQRVRLPGDAAAGPLSTTFLLAMATPIVVLPIERIWQTRDFRGEHYADERELDAKLSGAFDHALNGKNLKGLPFIAEDAWRFASVPYEGGPGLARSFAEHLEAPLQDGTSVGAAAAMQPSEWAACLRNSLAHGGVVYLDERGCQAWGREAKMLAFVSGKYNRDTRRLVGLRALRISETDFLSFLRLWVGWLCENKLHFDVAA